MAGRLPIARISGDADTGERRGAELAPRAMWEQAKNTSGTPFHRVAASKELAPERLVVLATRTAAHPTHSVLPDSTGAGASVSSGPYDDAGGDPMTDPIADLIGDYRAFTALQRDRLAARGIDIAPYELSHLAVRVPEWDQYVHLRTLLERHAIANRENVWNGRPISLILLVRAAPRPRRPGRPAHRAHPARPPAGLQDGHGAPRRGRRRGGRRVLPPSTGQR